MSKKVLAVLIAGMMTVSLAAPAARAAESGAEEDSLFGMIGALLGKGQELGNALEESGLVDELLGEEGLLNGIIPEGVDVGAIVGSVQEQLADTNSELYQTAEGILGMISGEDGNLDMSQIDSMIGSLFGGDFSGEEEGEEEPDDYEDYFDEMNEAMSRHVAEETAEYLEPGDESIISRVTSSIVTDEDGTIHVLGYFMITNYDVDGTDLVMKNAAGHTELLTLIPNEEGTLDVTDYQVAEDGEDYAKSLEPMCEAVGTTTEEYFASLMYTEMADVSEMIGFMKDHPEYERIEYMGELRTRDDLDTIITGIFEDYLAMFDMEDEEALTEEAVTE